MAKFNDAHKEERSNSKYFDEGIHEVFIGAVDFGTTPQGAEYCEFSVYDESGEREAKPRLWFNTDGAIGYSFGSIRNMFVHQAKTDAEKERVRAKFNLIEDTDGLNAAMQKALVAGKAQVWLQVYQDGTYEKNGQSKPSYNRDIYGYEPPVKVSDQAAKAAVNQPLKVTDGDGQEQTVADF